MGLRQKETTSLDDLVIQNTYCKSTHDLCGCYYHYILILFLVYFQTMEQVCRVAVRVLEGLHETL